MLKNVDIVLESHWYFFILIRLRKYFSEARKHNDENASNHADAGENSLSPPTIAQPAPSQQNVSYHIFI